MPMKITPLRKALMLLSLAIAFNVYATNRPQESKTIDDCIEELKATFKNLNLRFKAGVTNEQIIFGLQHTLADERQSDKGKKFPVTPEYLSKVVGYYKSYAELLKQHPAEVEIMWLYINALSDLTISKQESLWLSNSERDIQQKHKYATNSYYKFDNRRDEPTEVNTDPMLLAKEKDGMNEGIGFTLSGVDKIFMKQYLASLLEVIPK